MAARRANASHLLRIITAAAVCLLIACGPPRAHYPESLNSQRPDERVCAVCHAGQIKDRAAIGLLIDRLDDEDEAVRFFAIIALERMTGTRLGYFYHDPESQRRQAVQRWREYLASGAATQPARSGE